MNDADRVAKLAAEIGGESTDENDAKVARQLRELKRELKAATSIVDLKSDVNGLVWKHLPGGTTLDVAEDIAVEIFDIINKARRS